MTIKKLPLPYYAPNADASDKYQSIYPPGPGWKMLDRKLTLRLQATSLSDQRPSSTSMDSQVLASLESLKKLHEHLKKWKIKVVRHHELDLLANTIKTPGSFAHEQLRRATRALALNTIAESKDRFDTCYVFEDFVLNNEDGYRIMEEYRLLALRRGCSLIRIELTCDDVAYDIRLKDQGGIDFRTENNDPWSSPLTDTDQELVTSYVLYRGFSDRGLKSLDVSSNPEIWTVMSAAHHVMVTWNAGL
ncbi:hypothetical protein ACHAP4_011520 [Fusarium culmorum]